ncbi:MAG: HepT-like ribonuclease domain-containing protein [Roseiarcus sp.]
MRRDPKSLLWDARNAATVIADMTAGKTFVDFDGDIVLRSAVERQFEILGEALGQLDRLDATLGAKIPDLRQIVAFRNILIHGYALIDRARVLRAVEDDLPPLRAGLDDLLAEEQ